VIHRIAVDPQNVRILYAATSNYGILKTADGGKTWGLSNQGIRSFTHHAIIVNPLVPNLLYAGAWGGGVSKSTDGGGHWTEVNHGLGNTAIEDLVLDPVNPEKVYVATSTGVFASSNGGGDWIPYNDGLPLDRIEIYERLLALPSGPIELLLGTSQGLFQRERNASAWAAVDGVSKEEHITALAINPKTQALYAGTMKNGLLESRDGGKTWTALGGKIQKTWVSDIALDPRHSGVFYVSTRGNGVIKSGDGGKIWKEINQGLSIKDIRSLAMSPENPKILFAGTTHQGLAKTVNGGESWIPLTGYPLLSFTEIVDSLSIPPPQPRRPSDPPFPVEFFKCNRCHGWADSLLNQKKTYWRVPPNQRNWERTVARMSQRARLSPEEAKKIAEFLTGYTTGK
jgi:photosystem II stability/assembly factor-like uncharacterized protein